MIHSDLSTQFTSWAFICRAVDSSASWKYTGHGAPVVGRGDLVVEDDVLHLHWAQPFDRVGYSSEQRQHVVLAWALGIGLAEAPDRP